MATLPCRSTRRRRGVPAWRAPPSDQRAQQAGDEATALVSSSTSKLRW
jgi:hypothetical protein